MNEKSLTFTVTIFIVIIISIFVGSAIGQNDQTTPALVVLALIVVLTVAALGERTWILIPIFSAWGERISILPIPFSVSNLIVGLAVAVWMLSIATRRQKFDYRSDSMDIIIAMTLVLLFVGWYRNPVGLAAFASGSNIGGRPYAEVSIAFIAYVVLVGQRTQVSTVAKLPRWILVSAGIIAIGGTIAALVPGVGIVLFQFYNGFRPTISEIVDPYAVQEGIGRATYLRPLALTSVAVICAKCNPIKLIFPNHWWLAFFLAVATFLALVTGYRSALVAVAFYFIVGCWMWLRGVGLVVCMFAAAFFLLLIPIVQSFVPLPEQVQRSLSFLPGDWDDRIVRSGEDSNEWRIEMWETIIEEDMIENWWIGDGFGFPRSELEYYSYLQRTGSIRSDQLAKYYIITGDLHSGPLSSARFAGVIGGILFVLLAIMVFWRYLKMWRKLAYYPELNDLRSVIGFFCIISSYFPFKFLFVAGFYDRELPGLIVSAGLCRLFARLVSRETDEASRNENNSTEIGNKVGHVA